MTDVRAETLGLLRSLAGATAAEAARLLAPRVAPDGVWRAAAPVGDLAGADALAAGWFAPLAEALPGWRRRDELVLGGDSITGSGPWVATLGHYVGTFTRPLWGVAPSGRLAFLRVGEFYRLGADGRIAEARLLPDIPDMSRQAGRPLFPPMLGTEMLFPGPATHDGVLPEAPERSLASLRLVEAMLGDLRAYAPGTFESRGQTGPGGYWAEDMLWYGPAGIGANFRYEGFQRDHRAPFLTAFPDRVGGNHFARFGDGDYVASGGWPSMTMTHLGPYLGVAPTGRPLTLRVMDFWRCADGRIAENWVLLDLIDLFAQMGRDVLAEAA
jgi:predicted ester cyclase